MEGDSYPTTDPPLYLPHNLYKQKKTRTIFYIQYYDVIENSVCARARGANVTVV